ncbi:MAG: tRNA epoxyqueuosine(34) reductase QueG [Saprospiraceae bacterium]|nr:tRNA epoxyqueuosine(34) reductase QueG [Saprospiraceae bacterium]
MSNTLKSRLKEKAKELGFFQTGVAAAGPLEKEARLLEEWLNRGYHGKMTYMENHFELRTNPQKLVPGAKSVLTFLCNYHQEEKQKDPLAPKLASYAFGKDYHFVIKDKLKWLLSWLEEEVGQIEGRGFVDSAPVMERAWAEKTGLGWVGKNTLIIHPKAGSYFFLAVLITDLELEPDVAIKDYCGTCTRCIDACPTDAIHAEGPLMDASKCISYLTIELKEAIPEAFKGKMENWMFGCDICQEVCPWNRFSKPHQEPAFEPDQRILDFTKEDWEEITEDVFKEIFKKSAVKRTKFSGLKRNISFLKK